MRFFHGWLLLAFALTFVGEPLTVVARFVVQGAGQDCSGFTLAPDPAAAATAPPAARSTPDPSTFPVTLRQSAMPADWAGAALHDGGRSARIWLPVDGGGPQARWRDRHWRN